MSNTRNRFSLEMRARAILIKQRLINVAISFSKNLIDFAQPVRLPFSTDLQQDEHILQSFGAVNALVKRQLAVMTFRSALRHLQMCV